MSNRDAMAELIRQQVRDQIKAQVNTAPVTESEYQLDETAMAELTRLLGLTASMGIGGIAAGLGALGALTGMPGSGAMIATGLGLTGAGIFTTAKIVKSMNDRAFNATFQKLVRAVEARDKYFENAAKLDGQAAMEYLKTNKNQIKRATVEQQKAAREMRKFLAHPSNEQVVAGLSGPEQQNIDKFIDKAEQGQVSELPTDR